MIPPKRGGRLVGSCRFINLRLIICNELLPHILPWCWDPCCSEGLDGWDTGHMLPVLRLEGCVLPALHVTWCIVHSSFRYHAAKQDMGWVVGWHSIPFVPGLCEMHWISFTRPICKKQPRNLENIFCTATMCIQMCIYLSDMCTLGKSILWTRTNAYV